MELTVRVKGGKRLVELTAPADVKGTKALALSPSQMYVYLPVFGKVRRVASHVDQGFMGMTFALGDFDTRYGDRYTATVASESPSEVKLTAVPKADQGATYGRLELTVDKERMLPTEIRYFDAAGAHVKTETRKGITCQDGVCAASEVKMVDLSKGGAWTRLTRRAWKVNEDLDDALFTKRALEK
jgi:hypothetical protein